MEVIGRWCSYFNWVIFQIPPETHIAPENWWLDKPYLIRCYFWWCFPPRARWTPCRCEPPFQRLKIIFKWRIFGPGFSEPRNVRFFLVADTGPIFRLKKIPAWEHPKLHPRNCRRPPPPKKKNYFWNEHVFESVSFSFCSLVHVDNLVKTVPLR